MRTWRKINSRTPQHKRNKSPLSDADEKELEVMEGLSEFEHEVFSEKSDKEQVLGIKRKAEENADGRKFETSLEKILRAHRFGPEAASGGGTTGGGGGGGDFPSRLTNASSNADKPIGRLRTSTPDREILNLVENIDTFSKRAKNM